MWILAGPDELYLIATSQAPDLMSGVGMRLDFSEEPRPAPPAGQVRWLHLSDFHFRENVSWDRRTTLQALLPWAEKLKKRELGPDLVFLTGDVAFSGKRGEYDQAKDFLTKLAARLDLDPREHFFVVPGNHDVDQGRIKPAETSIRNALTSQKAVEDVLRDKPTMEFLAPRLEEFYTFTERLLGPPRTWTPALPWEVARCTVRDLDVAILALNSAWASGPNDARDLLVGEAQLRAALKQASGASLRIALVHHPSGELREFDRKKLKKICSGPDGVHFLLDGHLHDGEVQTTHGSRRELVELTAGAVYTEGSWPRRFFLTEVDLAAGRGRLHGFTWNEDRDAWTPDMDLSDDGVSSLELPAELRFTSGASPAQTVPAVRREALSARYRAQAVKFHGRVRWVGFAASPQRRPVEVPELFVPLSMTVQKPGSGTNSDAEPGPPERLTTAELLGKLAAGAAPDSDPQGGEIRPARVVLLGDPGSGKTTLCGFATVVLGGGLRGVADGEPPPLDVATLARLETSEVLPLFLPFRAYVRRSHDLSLPEFLEEQAR
ncbi:MAG: hypothetical protein GY856_52430, partial [bacterium]|nr:hypothetical protein [bacterium]